MPDKFDAFQAGLESPAENAELVTPHDTNDLANTSRGLWVGVGGNLNVIMKGQTSARLFENVPVGLFPFAVKRVLNTGTTASKIVAVW